MEQKLASKKARQTSLDVKLDKKISVKEIVMSSEISIENQKSIPQKKEKKKR